MLGLQRFTGGLATQFFRRATYSSSVRTSTAAVVPAGETDTGKTAADEVENPKILDKKPKNNLVAAAFESLNETNVNTTTTTATTTAANKSIGIDECISNAKSVNGLLSVSDNSGTISRQHALKVVSILAEWSTTKKVKLSEFENDARFLRLCRLLGRTLPKNNNNNSKNDENSRTTQPVDKSRIGGFRTDDLNTVLGVAGDDEAAKLIASISLPQMVKVMSTLAQRKRRSTPLLRSLAFNISSSADQLDLKQCADILYAMAVLNFQDSVLAAKTCVDVQAALPKNREKSAVVGSILTSLGIMKYRDLDSLEALTQWMLKYSDICRPQDISAYFLTSANLNFKSINLEQVQQKLTKSVVRADFNKPNDWLNHVWALSLLRVVDNKQLETVLCGQFLQELEKTALLTPTTKMKLLNLNSFSQILFSDYKGSLLSKDSNVYDVPMAHSKSKQILLNGLLDALKSLLPSSNHVKSLIDSRMGFLIDALCVFDNKRNPLPLNKEHNNAIKLAWMIVDFHDVCHGPHKAASGQITLSFDLLEKSGYKVIPVPYNEFNTSDKLLKRVQYLEAKIKATTSSSSKK